MTAIRTAGAGDAAALATLRALFLTGDEGDAASRWGCVSNMFVREEARAAGGDRLLVRPTPAG